MTGLGAIWRLPLGVCPGFAVLRRDGNTVSPSIRQNWGEGVGRPSRANLGEGCDVAREGS